MPPSSKKLARQRFPVRSTGDFLMATDNRRALERELAHPPVRTAILDLPWGAGAGFVAVSTSFGPTYYFDSAPPGAVVALAGRDCSTLIWPRLGVRAWAAGRCRW